MKTFDDWRTEILSDIERLSERGVHAHYVISARMSNATAHKIKDYFSSNGFDVEMKNCLSCKSTYDFIFEWQ